jgi:hypothetical protein
MTNTDGGGLQALDHGAAVVTGREVRLHPLREGDRRLGQPVEVTMATARAKQAHPFLDGQAAPWPACDIFG